MMDKKQNCIIRQRTELYSKLLFRRKIFYKFFKFKTIYYPISIPIHYNKIPMYVLIYTYKFFLIVVYYQLYYFYLKKKKMLFFLHGKLKTNTITKNKNIPHCQKKKLFKWINETKLGN